jgi:hypothetical protein
MHKSDIIAGGIDVNTDSLTIGGKEYVVGENAKWHMRNKFLAFKHRSDTAEKNILKIININIPITFSKKNYYSDGGDMPIKTETEIDSDVHIKRMRALEHRISEDIDDIVHRLELEYNLYSPLLWVISDMLKFTVNVYKNKCSKKVNVSPEVASYIDKIWKYGPSDKYVEVEHHNIMDLILDIMELIKKSDDYTNDWTEPVLEDTPYPCWCSISKTDIMVKILEERHNLKLKISTNSYTEKEIVSEYVFTLLCIENIVIDYVYDLEKYYIGVAKNMSKILDSLRVFFK